MSTPRLVFMMLLLFAGLRVTTHTSAGILADFFLAAYFSVLALSLVARCFHRPR